MQLLLRCWIHSNSQKLTLTLKWVIGYWQIKSSFKVFGICELYSVSILTAIIPGGPVLASTRVSPFWILLELRIMELVMTTGAVRCAKLQSSRNHQQTNTQLFYRLDALPVAQPTVSEHWRFLWWTVLKVVKRKGLPMLRRPIRWCRSVVGPYPHTSHSCKIVNMSLVECVVWCAGLPPIFHLSKILLLGNRGNGVQEMCLRFLLGGTTVRNQTLINWIHVQPMLLCHHVRHELYYYYLQMYVL